MDPFDARRSSSGSTDIAAHQDANPGRARRDTRYVANRAR
jgi:hypothetical protein